MKLSLINRLVQNKSARTRDDGNDLGAVYRHGEESFFFYFFVDWTIGNDIISTKSPFNVLGE